MKLRQSNTFELYGTSARQVWAMVRITLAKSPTIL